MMDNRLPKKHLSHLAVLFMSLVLLLGPGMPLQAQGPLGDLYEPDGTSGIAKTITSGETQQRSIHIAGDTDWVKFTLAGTSAATIRMTIPISSASLLYLYGPDDATQHIAHCTSNTSWVAQLVFPATNPLAPGTYYLKLREYSGLYPIDSYTLTLTTTASAIAIPTLSPTPGPCVNPTTVTISCTTPGATIHYTTDGVDPTVNSPVYTAPFTLTSTTTVKALAMKSGLPASGIVSGLYIMPDIYEPDNTPAGAKIITSGETQQRAIHVAGDTDWVRFTLPDTSAVTIRMTIPIASASQMYLYGPDNATQQIAYSPSNTSLVAQLVFPSTNPLAPGTYYLKLREYSGLYPIDSYTLSLSTTALAIAIPTLSPTPGPCANPTTVTISCATSGTTIHYTTDGADPTVNSPVYTAPFTLTSTTTVKALATKSGLPASRMVSGTYMMPDNYEPDDDPASAKDLSAGETQQRSRHLAADVDWLKFTLTEKSAVTISMSEPGSTSAIMLYGPNDATTAITGSGYFSPLAPGTYYICVKPYSDAFPAAAPGYTISLTVVPAVAMPAFSLSPGWFNGLTPVPVSIDCATPGAALHYTTDGSDPTTSSPVYTGPLAITSTTTVKAIATKEGMPASDMACGVYTINMRPTVSINPPADGMLVEKESGSIPITVNAQDPDDAVAKVVLYAQSGTDAPVCIGVQDSAPFTFQWKEGHKGTYTLTAIASDMHGLSTSAAPVTVVVKKAEKDKPKKTK